MVAPTAGLLKRPPQPGFMGPMVVLQIVRVVETMLGLDAREHLMKEARLFRLPSQEEPVREENVARLHQTLRQLWPDRAGEMARAAGETYAEFVMEYRLPARAQSLLSSMPKTAGAWLLARTAEQQAWTFAGSGDFHIESSSRFVLRDNPLVRGEHASHAVCDFHAGFFERLYQSLIHPRLACHEIACGARGDAACTFEFAALTPR